MTSVKQLYAKKDKDDKSITTAKTYFVSPELIHIDPSLNIRELYPESVEYFRQAYVAGEFVPPIVVQMTEKGIWAMDGQHRTAGAKAALKDVPHLKLEVVEFKGNEAERVAFMITSSQGRPLTAMERARAYLRLKNQGLNSKEIAAKVKRSYVDVDNHLNLLSAPDDLIEMVQNNEVAMTTALALSKEHGPAAATVAKEKLQEQKKKGKTKLTSSAAITKFSAKKAARIVELTARLSQVSGQGGQVTVTAGNEELHNELYRLICEAQDFYRDKEEAESADTETDTEVPPDSDSQ